MLHEPTVSSGPDHGQDVKTRLGVWMFLLYAVIYVGFVVINVVKPAWMDWVFPGIGLNLAVIYGFGLIVLALVLALIYNGKCARAEADGAAQAAAAAKGEDA